MSKRNHMHKVTAPSWWSNCVRLGPNNLFFIAGVLVGLAGNIVVSLLFEFWSLTAKTRWLVGFSTIAFVAFGWCLQSIAILLKNCEDAFFDQQEEKDAEENNEVSQSTWVTNTSWTKLKGWLLCFTVASILIALSALVVGLFVFQPRPSLPEKSIIATPSKVDGASDSLLPQQPKTPETARGTNGNVTNRN